MKILFGPAISIMSRLGLRQKLILLGLVALLPFLALAYHYYQLLNIPVSITVSEREAKELDLFVFVISTFLAFVYLLYGQYFESKNIVLKIKNPVNKINIALFHQEYVPLINYFRNKENLTNRKLDKVMASVSEVSSAAVMLVNMAQNSAEGSHQQGLAINSIASAIEEMSASLQQVEEQASSTRESSEISNKLANEGEKVSQLATQDILNIATSVKESSALIFSLGDR